MKASSNRVRVGCKKQIIWQLSIFWNAVIGNIAGQIFVITFFLLKLLFYLSKASWGQRLVSVIFFNPIVVLERVSKLVSVSCLIFFLKAQFSSLKLLLLRK